MDRIKSRTINWQRSILIDSSIDDEFVRRITPQILALRQENNDPIAVGINSPGGSLTAVDVLIGLLTGPDQDGKTGDIITVATNRAYSAAASFLAFGDYAVALRHSQILYHDVRFSGMEDVTPEKARIAAKSLQDLNDTFSLRLASKVISRLTWIYIDLSLDFSQIQQAFPKPYSYFSKIVDSYAPKVDADVSCDLASFATSLWAKLSSQNDNLIRSVMTRLERWISLMNFTNSAPSYRQKRSRIPGILDGPRYLHKLMKGRPDQFEASEEGLKLLINLIVAEISDMKTERVIFPRVLDRAIREYYILDSMNHPKHIKNATDLMLREPYVFFQNDIAKLSDSAKQEIYTKAAPCATLLWLFCVLLCRELFEGEHVLTPQDAQLLGLVDEVSGGGPIESKRDYWIRMDQSAAAPPAAPDAQAAETSDACGN
jgi:ATP-dependent protease ClpP protease subunit